ncbi:ABC-type transporter, periplasmic subunit [Candidatus Protofrankia datiscae]|uniref:ABC-type transporter, periplasmic subunit n=2 Tax=Candidatus Protofrankia datiscae TaxID=2716812 RepID=F8B5I2_9ACTN|nr:MULTISPECIES: ABC transporter substrate-binding protein [Protofrankia]AEH09152.1 ABC-type transporter, periplasmic subunit [Candidatus Protofrankia datiscae]
MPARLLCLVVLATVVACGGGGQPAPAPVTSITPTVTSDPTDKPGGTLRLVTGAMPSGDPGWATDAGSRMLLRLVSRQLYSYRASPDPVFTAAPLPDLAVGPPVVSEDGKTHTVTLRPSARWDTPGVRRVTATDVARGIKRLCTPPNPSPMRGYFAATVVGFATYCDELMKTPPEGVRDFIERRGIDGVQVIGDDSIEFHLLAPAADFTDVLALPAASPVPLEALVYAPNSPEYLENLISDGPYHFGNTLGDESYRLSRNPAWVASSDGIRPALADHVTVRTGVDAATAQAEIDADRADMAMDSTVPAADVTALDAQADGRLSTDGPGSTVLLTVGLHGPASAALGGGGVRQALVYCVDRAAVAAALGGPVLATTTAQMLQPAMTGFQSRDPFPTLGSTGDPARCREGTRTAADGGPLTTLVLLTTDSAEDAAVASALRDAFARAGVTLRVEAVPAADYPGVAVPSSTVGWDLALTRVTPQWFGNAGRSVFQPLLEPQWSGSRPADGGYRNDRIAQLLRDALGERDPAALSTRWGDLERELLTDAAIIPLAVTVTPRFHSANVRGFLRVPSLDAADPTAISLGIA